MLPARVRTHAARAGRDKLQHLPRLVSRLQSQRLRHGCPHVIPLNENPFVMEIQLPALLGGKSGAPQAHDIQAA